MEPVGHKTSPVSPTEGRADGTPLSRTPKGPRAYGLNAKGKGPRSIAAVARGGLFGGLLVSLYARGRAPVCAGLYK